ncbi:hypothetical protein Scep_012503 [Stephania cephalantha]|uniref:Uncharacterized protein n=1 Tax=Stephania cephalantha TaxID=152367 RepID=A0AAP0JH85_9MAGN
MVYLARTDNRDAQGAGVPVLGRFGTVVPRADDDDLRFCVSGVAGASVNGFELLSAIAIETVSFRGVCRSSCRLPSLPLKPSPSSELFIVVVYSVPHRRFKFDCAVAVSDPLALLGTSSLQGSTYLRNLVFHLEIWLFLCILEFPSRRLLRLLILFQSWLIGLDALQYFIHSLSFKRSIREVAELYGCEKSLPVVEMHRSLSGLHSIALSAFERQDSFDAIPLFDLLNIDSSLASIWDVGQISALSFTYY